MPKKLIKSNGQKNQTMKLFRTHQTSYRKNHNGMQLLFFYRYFILESVFNQYYSNDTYRLRFKNVKNSDHGRYSCLIGGYTDNGMFTKWRNFTLVTYKRLDSTGAGKPLKMTVPQSLSHHKDGSKPKFMNKPYMDNNIALLIGDARTLSCPFESKSR